MTQISDAADVLVASRGELVAMQRGLTAGAEAGVDADQLLGHALALCIDADSVFVALLAGANPHEPADVIIARYRRRLKAMLIRWGVVAPLIFVGLLLLAVVVVTLVSAFIWHP